MQKKLQWNAVGIKKHVDYLITAVNSKREDLPRENAVSFRRLTGFLDQLNKQRDTIVQIDETIIPELENIFRVSFKTPELIYLALSRPSIRNIFEDLETEFSDDENFKISKNSLEELQSSGDAGNVLALIGDAVLDLAVVQVLWDSSLANVGHLTQKRVEIVANKNLTKFSDRLKLYDFRLCKYGDPSEKDIKEKALFHEKGTLVEAIIGVIYLESGFEEVERIVPLLR